MSIKKNNIAGNPKKNTSNSTDLVSLTQNTLGNLQKVIKKKKIEEFAVASKFIQRSSSKINGTSFLLSMLISRLDPEYSSLERLSDILHSIDHNIRITPQSIMERINSKKTLLFFTTIFQNLLKNQLDHLCTDVPPNLLVSFTKILIQDSSSIELNEKLFKEFKGSGGRGSKASAKIDVIYDFKTKRYEHIKITDHSEADQRLSLDILDYVEPNALVIRDLGYLRTDCLMSLVKMNAFFLSRYKTTMHVYKNENDDDEFDLGEYLYKNCKYDSVVEINTYLTTNKFPVRLIAYRVPKDVAAERRRKAHATAKKQGRTLSKKHLTLLDFSIFITNVPVEIWPAEVVGTIYRLRWQIELLYKSWKSTLKIDYLKGIDLQRIKVLIYASLILAIIINQIYKLMNYIGFLHGRVVSMYKVYNWMRDVERLKMILNGRFHWWEERHLKDLVFLCMLKQNRADRKTSVEAIEDHDFYYQKAS